MFTVVRFLYLNTDCQDFATAREAIEYVILDATQRQISIDRYLIHDGTQWLSLCDLEQLESLVSVTSAYDLGGEA